MTILCVVYILISPASQSIFNLVHGLSEQYDSEYIKMSHKEVAVHVITGLKQRVYSAFEGYSSCGLVFSYNYPQYSYH